MTIDDIDEISLSRVDTEGNLPAGVGLSVEEQKSRILLLRQHSRNFIVRGIRGMIHWNMKMEGVKKRPFLLVFKKFMLLPMIASEFF